MAKTGPRAGRIADAEGAIRVASPEPSYAYRLHFDLICLQAGEPASRAIQMLSAQYGTLALDHLLPGRGGPGRAGERRSPSASAGDRRWGPFGVSGGLGKWILGRRLGQRQPSPEDVQPWKRASGEGSGSRPLVLGVGGTVREGSSTEKALACALRHAEAMGADTRLLGGAFLARLPIFDPRPGAPTPEQAEFAEAVCQADGIIVASPGYHGSISGVMKNALDTLELTREAACPYFSGKPVGTIITADGWQAAGTTLMALRAIVHALRGWPTPFGAALNAGTSLFDEGGKCRLDKDEQQLASVAEQVVDFARMKAAAP